MQKFFLLLFTFFCIISCEVSTNKQGVFTNKSQNDFERILVKYNKVRYGNDIQKSEAICQLDSAIFHYIDSVKYFVNWKSKIQDLSVKDRVIEGKQYKELTFQLYYTPEKYREVRFDCASLIDVDSLEVNLLYNKVKNISNYSEVYFDGIIQKNNLGDYDKRLVKYSRSASDLVLSYPVFKFTIFNVTQQQRSDTISESLKQLVDLDIEFFNYVEANSKSKNKIKQYADHLKPVVDSLRMKLTKDEVYWRTEHSKHYFFQLKLKL